MTPLGQPNEGDRFQIDASFDDKCGIRVEPKDTFIEDHSIEESYVVEFSVVTPPMELVDPIHT